jgi:hypothetical protein
MIKLILVYTKSGNDTWDYFLDPGTVPADNPVHDTWKECFLNLYGTNALEMFPTLKFTFTVISPQELHIQWEIPDLETLKAWGYYFSAFTPRPAETFYNLLEILYPGETIAGHVEIIETVEGLYDSGLFEWLDEVQSSSLRAS